ncbi:hypothetical protein BH09BAC1_BH09BAC1_27060 [soil metagenome]
MFLLNSFIPEVQILLILSKMAGMYWQDKLHEVRAKHDLAEHELRSPFTDWPAIMKKIEANFIIKANSNNHFTNWILHLKTALITQQSDNIADWKTVLPESLQYYLVLTGKVASNKHFVFDCSPKALEVLVDAISDSHFYVVDKKYQWMVLFNRDEAFKRVMGYKLLESK